MHQLVVDISVSYISQVDLSGHDGNLVQFLFVCAINISNLIICNDSVDQDSWLEEFADAIIQPQVQKRLNIN